MPAVIPFIPAIIGGVASIGSSLIGSHASSSAANFQQAAAGDIKQQIQPYLGLGNQAASTLSSMLSQGGQVNPFTYFAPPDPNSVSSTPEYQFQMQQGQRAVQSSAAAQGGLFSGGTLKSLDQYGQGLASTAYQQAYNNSLNTYNTNVNGSFSRLLALSGLGEQSLNPYAQAVSGAANAQSANATQQGNIWQSLLGNLATTATGAVQQSQQGQGTPVGTTTGPQPPAGYWPNTGGYGGSTPSGGIIPAAPLGTGTQTLGPGVQNPFPITTPPFVAPNSGFDNWSGVQ